MAEARDEEGAFSRENTRHENAERLGYGEDQSQENENLQPAINGHFRSELSELLRAQKRVEQVHRYYGADDEHDEGLYIHKILLLHAITKTNVCDRRGKKRDRDRDPKNVLHGISLQNLIGQLRA